MIHFCIFNIVIFTQVVKQLWAYTRQNNPQDPDYKRKIICNDKLHFVFGTDAVGIFKMNKLLVNHIPSLDLKHLLVFPIICTCIIMVV
jgi:chromatin remodeling complex protein RSC6